MVDPNPVYLPYPLNPNHRLNIGRVAWWLCLPNRMAGFTWYDIAGRNPGTLTSMGNANNGWRGTTRPGGWGAMLFGGSGSPGYVLCPPVQPQLISISFWIFSAGANAYLIDSDHDATTFGTTVQIFGSQIYWSLGNVHNNAFAFTISGYSGQWLNCALTYDGATMRLYLNGLPMASQAASGNIAWQGSNLYLGIESISLTFPFSGYLDGISIWSRGLSAIEVHQDYLLSRQGYPGVLNRYPTIAYSLPPVITGTTLGPLRSRIIGSRQLGSPIIANPAA